MLAVDGEFREPNTSPPEMMVTITGIRTPMRSRVVLDGCPHRILAWQATFCFQLTVPHRLRTDKLLQIPIMRNALKNANTWTAGPASYLMYSTFLRRIIDHPLICLDDTILCFRGVFFFGFEERHRVIRSG
jgi:hypothetical protein